MDKCVICNNNLDKKPEYCNQDKCLVLSGDCEHTFHKDCLDVWFRRIQKSDCPLCRKSFIPKVASTCL